ncbi:MAG TPA: hypothetical protein ENN05_04120 [Deltaproteobacteria bacterium]|nr:hypothetical protein [Deltaproteobacteria bacterium]
MKAPFAGMIKRSQGIITGILIMSAVFLSFFFIIDRPEDLEHEQEMTDSISVHGTRDFTGDYPLETDGKKQKISLEDRLVAELQQYYGKTISEKSTQAMLLRIKNFLTGLYQKDGESRFYAILKKAFPGLADEIMQTLEKMEQYNTWLDENKSTISGLNDLEKQGMLWQKRRGLFGDDADIIWSEEILAYEKRKQEMKDTIRMLDGSNDTTIDEKLFIFKSTISQAYKGSPEAYILENTGMLSKVFFGIDSVQEELSAMEPEKRMQELARIRKDMGYTSEQIAELKALDDYRNRRWENGLIYMQERERAASEFTGAELDEQLRILREKYFKHEAKTIEIEENDGFFRFERKRIYGRN